MNKLGSTVALALLVAVGLSACGESSSDGGSGSSTAPDTVEATMLADLTGGAAFCGKEARAGAEAAVKKVNESKLLGDSTLKITFEDTATKPRQAASVMTEVARSEALATLFGCASSVAQAIAPVAQQIGIPLVAMQSGSDGVIDAGEHVFRATAPQSSYQNLVVDQLTKQGVTSAAIVYQSDNPTLVKLAEDTYPDLLGKAGITVVTSEKFQSTGFDFGALTSGVAGKKPGAVVVLGQGTPNVTVISQLRQAGFTGTVVGSASFSADVLAPLGTRADGALWATDFALTGTAPSTQEFVKYYQGVSGDKAPSQFAAEGWDAVMLLANGLKATTSFDRDGVRKGLEKAAGAGFDGAVGKVTFDGRDARVPGVLVTWKDGKEQGVS